MIVRNGKRLDGAGLDTLPIGTIQPFIGATAPEGYLLCQGQLVSKIIYSKLYEICGDIFGEGTETEFRLPDLRGKTIAGLDPEQTDFASLGISIGSLKHLHSTGNHTLTVGEMPSHNHPIDNKKSATTFATTASGYAPSQQSGTRVWTPITDEILSTQSTGGGRGHNHGNTSEVSNLQPTMVLNYIVKAYSIRPQNEDIMGYVKLMILESHPIGDIISNTSGVNPSTYLGGEWIAWGSGRVPVGVDTSNIDFDTVEKTGGNASHTHTSAAHTHTTGNHTLTANESGLPSHNHKIWQRLAYGANDPYQGINYGSIVSSTLSDNIWSDSTGGTNASSGHNHGNTGSTTPDNTGSSSNYQPYITCYMWKRIG